MYLVDDVHILSCSSLRSYKCVVCCLNEVVSAVFVFKGVGSEVEVGEDTTGSLNFCCRHTRTH